MPSFVSWVFVPCAVFVGVDAAFHELVLPIAYVDGRVAPPPSRPPAWDKYVRDEALTSIEWGDTFAPDRYYYTECGAVPTPRSEWSWEFSPERRDEQVAERTEFLVSRLRAERPECFAYAEARRTKAAYDVRNLGTL